MSSERRPMTRSDMVTLRPHNHIMYFKKSHTVLWLDLNSTNISRLILKGNVRCDCAENTCSLLMTVQNRYILCSVHSPRPFGFQDHVDIPDVELILLDDTQLVIHTSLDC